MPAAGVVGGGGWLPDYPAADENHFQGIALPYAIYRGDFLADFYLDDSNAYEDWAQVTREAYRRKALDALDLLTAVATRQGDYAKAQTGNYTGPYAPDINDEPAQAAMDVNYSVIPVRPAGAANPDRQAVEDGAVLANFHGGHVVAQGELGEESGDG